MFRRFVVLSSLVTIMSTCPSGMAHASRMPESGLSKIDPALLEGAGAPREVLVILEEQADLRGVEDLHDKRQKGTFVHERLREVAERTQARIRRHLQDRGIAFRSFWILNMLRVEATLDDMVQLAQFPEVASIRADPQLDRAPLVPSTSSPLPRSPSTVEWNVARVGATLAWNDGVTGKGAVVGSMDTGFDWTHPALIEQYRGYDRGSVDHSYNWHDAIHNDVGPCGADSPEPCDSDSHGTLTMGTSVGDDGGANQIGVAPGAEWIGCRCWEQVRRTHFNYVAECFEWFVAPTDLDDAHPDPARAPHVINNSWICEGVEGCVTGTELQQIVENVRAAGIVVVASAGNSGIDGCASVTDPPAIYDAAFTVGSTNMQDALSAFSSRGPVMRDGSGRIKPDIVAPGEAVRSSIPGGGYESGVSGTSLAGPIVAGTVALLIDAVPSLAGDVDAIEQILVDSAIPMVADPPCGDLSVGAVPNNHFGWGRVDAWAAVQLAQDRETGIADPVDEEDQTSSEPVARFRLLPNRPNPFNPHTRVRYEIPRQARISLRVHDAGGHLVRTLVASTIQEPGRYDVLWDGRNDERLRVASGVYFARLEVDGRVLAGRPLTLVR
jgi:hypothetical protein